MGLDGDRYHHQQSRHQERSLSEPSSASAFSSPAVAAVAVAPIEGGGSSSNLAGSSAPPSYQDNPNLNHTATATAIAAANANATGAAAAANAPGTLGTASSPIPSATTATAATNSPVPGSRLRKGNLPTTALQPPQGPPPETFLEDMTPVNPVFEGDYNSDGSPRRDSPDLSFDSVGRTSVVDNMLLSLDQLQMARTGGGGARGGAPAIASALDRTSSNAAPTSSADFTSSQFHHDGNVTNHTNTDAGPPPPPKSPSYNRYYHHHHHNNSDGNRSTRSRLRRRGHTQSSSLSSDYDLYVDDSSSKYSHISKGRRSNSGSNFHLGGLGRVEGLRTGPRVGPGTRTGGETSGRWFADFTGESNTTTMHSRGAGRKGSKSSGGSSSVDMGYRGNATVLGTAKIGFGKRSASFDHSFGGGVDGSDDHSTSILARGRPVPAYESLDAAPTPTVAAGPRWHEGGHAVSARPPYNPIHAPPIPAPTSSFAPWQTGSGGAGGGNSINNASRPATSNRIRRGKVDALDPAVIRSQANDFVEAASFRDRSFSAALATPPAPSPTVARQKPFASVASLANAAVPNDAGAGAGATADLPRERPGFFRRVFGGTRNRSPTRNNSVPSMSDHRVREISPSYTYPGMHNHIASQLKTAPRQTLIEAPETLPKEPAAPLPSTLSKKSSSFFRRRKKSVSENTRPPLHPVHPAPPAADVGNGPYPVQRNHSTSSLRQALNPYLGESSRVERYFDAIEQPGQTRGPSYGGLDGADDSPAGFSQEPNARQNSTASRAVASGSRNQSDGSAPSSRDGAAGAAKRVREDAPRLKLKVKKGVTSPTTSPHENTFLADNSSPEARSGKHSPNFLASTLTSFDGRQRPKTSPTSPSLPQLPFQDQENRGPRRRPDIEDDKEGLAGKKPTLDGQDLAMAAMAAAARREQDAWLVISPTKRDEEQPSTSTSSKSNRIWLLPTSSEEKLHETGRPKPLTVQDTQATPIATPASVNDVFHSATSLPLVQVDALPETTDPPDPLTAEPTTDDKERARKIYNGEEGFVDTLNAVPCLGSSTPESSRTRKAYMRLFDWSGCNILLAMRGLCAKLVLKGETQQVDRVLDAFSARWCECNPNHGFKVTDVVHTISYSLLLLNTDLHLADIESKMTRIQFVKNTLPTIRRVVEDAAASGDPERTIRANTSQARGTIPWVDSSTPASPTFPNDADNERRPSLEIKKSRNRLSARPPPAARGDSDGTGASDLAASDNCNVLVRFPYEGPIEKWEFHIEIVLKDFYNSIRQQRLPLHGAGPDGIVEQPSVSSLSVVASSMLRRTPSVLSKAPSETVSYRGRLADFRSVGARLSSKSRSRPRLYPTSTIGSSRTSLDDPSPWSPTGSSTWSKYSFSKTQTTASVDSTGSGAKPDYQQSIGFANALSQAIIREEGLAGAEESLGNRAVPLLEDETLELAGAPWAKEGILKHKHHLESLDKKAKDRNWVECFAVIEKGWIRLFSFNTKSSASTSLRLRSNKLRANSHSAASGTAGASNTGGAVVGGGNWTENAEALGSFLLRQTIASALPPPGYSKSRPHVWALSLPTGAVHLFQVGTSDIVKEFVSTANYWSARLSKEPLVGGVSNIEYGWSDAVINAAAAISTAASSVSSLSQPQQSQSLYSRHHRQQSSGNAHPPSTANSAAGGSSTMPRRPSLAGSARASLERSVVRLPGDRVVISEWTPPVQSMMASVLMEVDQLRALTAYVKSVEEELKRHTELRSVMSSAFSPRNPNLNRALGNWERKSSYLLREIVKFSTYIDSLAAAQALKEKIYSERKRGEPLTKGVSADELAARVTGSGPGEGSGDLDEDVADGGSILGGSANIAADSRSGITDALAK